MKKIAIALYSTLVYVLFLGTLLYAVGFVEGIVVPKAIDSGEPGDLSTSVLVNLVLLGVFAVQHSGMARQGFKRVLTRVIPEEAERSTYVLMASLALALLLWQWRAMPQTVWSIQNPVAASTVTVISWLGWGMVLLSTFLISHFHLFGVTQGFAKLLNRSQPAQEFTTPMLYRYLRHPIYAGFIVAFWAAPQMSVGHLLFAVATTGYILIGIWLEERDLVAHFGARYLEYRRTAGMLFPRLR